MTTSINDLRHAFFGGVGAEQATLQAFYDVGLSAADFATVATGVITQTYATADATHAARTAADPAAATAVAPASTAATLVTPAGYSTVEQADAIRLATQALITDVASIRTQLTALRADHLDTAQLLNHVIDRLQAAGNFAT